MILKKLGVMLTTVPSLKRAFATEIVCGKEKYTKDPLTLPWKPFEGSLPFANSIYLHMNGELIKMICICLLKQV